MFDKAKYVNSEGKTIAFGEKNIFINSSDIRDYKWNYTEDNGKITELKKGIVQKTMPLIIVCSSKDEGIRIKNDIFEVFEIDVIKSTMGKLIINDYYLPCYIVESKKSNYLYNDGYLELTVSVLTDFDYWCNEYEKVFHAAPESIENEYVEEKIQEIIDSVSSVPNFPFDFPFDFKSKYRAKNVKHPMFDFPFDFKKNFNINRFINDHYAPCEFILYIYGACLNPAIYINSHLYEVRVNLSDGDYMIIDSKEKTITKYGKNGDTTNLFNFRNKQSDIFKKIDNGKVSIRWSATFTFKLVVLKERSEPPWK